MKRPDTRPISSFLLALEAWWALLWAAVVIRVPFGRRMVLCRAMNNGAITRRIRQGSLGSLVIRIAVGQGARFHLKSMTCLEQSLALVWMHRRRGLPATLRIGGRRDGTDLRFHAWAVGPKSLSLELDDQENPFVPLAPVTCG